MKRVRVFDPGAAMGIKVWLGTSSTTSKGAAASSSGDKATAVISSDRDEKKNKRGLAIHQVLVMTKKQ